MLKRVLLVAAGLAAAAAVGSAIYLNLDRADLCDVCYRPLHQETYYRIHMTGGKALDVCCPRCGLRFQEGRTDVTGAEVTDFETHELVDADEAFYVDGSLVHFCSHAPLGEDRSGTQYEIAWDRCLPSLIAFATRSEAVEFQEDNGGTIKTYDELLSETVP